MPSRTRQILRVITPLLILGGGIGLASLLFASREEPEKSDPDQKAVLVETRTVERDKHRVDVEAQGTVVPARQVQLNPQVSGRLVDVHDNLQTGGLIRKGETLAQIDRSDYALTVEQRETDLAEAKANLDIEQGQQVIAKEEWELFQQQVESADIDSSLALRKPQLQQARVGVEAAEANLKQAQLNLSRTTVEAPFNAVVRDESTEIGQLVNAQSSLATLVGTDKFWVRVSIPVERIPDISIPGVNSNDGSPVQIQYSIGRKSIEREGRVLRLQSDLDPQGRMARVLVTIDDPLQLEKLDDDQKTDPTAGTRGIPLLLDAYVDVHIRGRRTEPLVEVPRQAIRNGDQAYIVDENDTLEIRTVDIVARRSETLLVRSGVEDGDRLVMSPIASPIKGMSLRTKSTDDQRDSDSTAAPGDRQSDEASSDKDAQTDGGRQ